MQSEGDTHTHTETHKHRQTHTDTHRHTHTQMQRRAQGHGTKTRTQCAAHCPQTKISSSSLRFGPLSSDSRWVWSQKRVGNVFSQGLAKNEAHNLANSLANRFGTASLGGGEPITLRAFPTLLVLAHLASSMTEGRRRSKAP